MWKRLGRALLAALLVACGSEEAPETSRDAAYQARVQQTLEGKSGILRRELAKTCDKWMHPTDEPCDPEAVRADQLDCWYTEGLPLFEVVKSWRPRARDKKLLLHVNLCMEKRRWKKVVRGPDF
jgi:hypothetical protein